MYVETQNSISAFSKIRVTLNIKIHTNVLYPKPQCWQPQITWPDFHNREPYQQWSQRGHKLIGEIFTFLFSHDGSLINLRNGGLWALEPRRKMAERIKVVPVYGGGIRKMWRRHEDNRAYEPSARKILPGGNRKSPLEKSPWLRCRTRWLTLTRVRVVMWYHGNPTLVPKEIPLCYDPSKEMRRSELGARGSKAGKQLLLLPPLIPDSSTDCCCLWCSFQYQYRYFASPKAAEYVVTASNNILKEKQKEYGLGRNKNWTQRRWSWGKWVQVLSQIISYT